MVGVVVVPRGQTLAVGGQAVCVVWIGSVGEGGARVGVAGIGWCACWSPANASWPGAFAERAIDWGAIIDGRGIVDRSMWVA